MPLELSKKLILASNSPRRSEIMSNAGFVFSKEVRETDEKFSSEMPLEEVPVYLAAQKAAQFVTDKKRDIVLCADTVVICNEEIMNKPTNFKQAYAMLEKLTGKSHDVVTGVALMIDGVISTFSDKTKVYFNQLDEKELNFYINECRPYDKAGAYGIQEYIGMVGIEKLEGSYYTVMGLPIHLVYKHLKPFLIF